MFSCQVNDRIIIDGQRATVRYVGLIADQEGPWIGLEWDHPGRGKHDGTANGHKYFHCQFAKGAGTFVRASKLPAACRGQSLADAIRQRYCDTGSEGLFTEVTGRRQPAVQFVGLSQVQQRQGNLARLEAASLPNAAVSSTGELAPLVPALTSLDLTGSLLSSWQAVQQLAPELPGLQTLDLSSSRLTMPQAPQELLPLQLAALQTLVLSSCCVTWAQMSLVAATMPQLRELHLGSNNISSLSSGLKGGEGQSPAALQHLELLDLEGNAIADWAEVLKLAVLPSLRHLWLGSNRLQRIAGSAAQGALSGLQTLLLRDNQISDWACIDALNAFPDLRDLRLSGNPILEGQNANCRYEVIARVPSLAALNGSAVGAHERRDSELRYLRMLTGQLESLKSDEATAELMAHHPRFSALSSQYGEMAGTVGAATGSAAQPSAMQELQLVCVAPSAGGRMGTQVKKLPVSLTVGKLKVVVERLFKVKQAKQALFLQVSSDDPCPENIGDQEDRELYYFGIQAGSAIVIDEVAV